MSFVKKKKKIVQRQNAMGYELRSFKSSAYINEKGDGLYRGFGYLSLFSDPIDLATCSFKFHNHLKNVLHVNENVDLVNGTGCKNKGKCKIDI